MKRSFYKYIALALLGLLVLGIFIYKTEITQPRLDDEKVVLTDLQSIAELQDLFNRNDDTPRLVLVLSPT